MNKKKTVVLTLLIGALFLSMPLAKSLVHSTTDTGYEMNDSSDIISAVTNINAKVSDSTLIAKTAVPVFTKLKKVKVKKTPIITLTSGNSVVLRGAVSSDSMNKLKYQILKLSQKLPKSANIYLVLDTPGGSVTAGLGFIDVVKAIPQKVHTITLFAASMGFQIVQNLDNRYITTNGTLMSHRAKISGIGGELPGELIVRLNHILRSLKRMDVIAARRAGMTLKSYRELISDEYWVDGFEAVNHKMADREVLLKCSKHLVQSKETLKINSFFGEVELTFSKCPLLTSPIDTSYNFTTNNVKSKTALKHFVEGYYYNRRDFVKRYINTGLYKSFVR